MIALQLEDVSYRYTANQTEVLHNVSFTLDVGEWICLLGRSGTGKSTLGKMCAGLLAPNSGSIRTIGITGWMAQNPSDFFIGSTVYEDIAFGPRNLGYQNLDLEVRVTEALEFVGLSSNYLMRDPHRLSGGERQRVALAGVLALRPELLILDEPASMLDIESRDLILEAVRKVTNGGCAVMYLTHSAEEALWADRALILSDGHITGNQHPTQVLTDPQLCDLAGMHTPKLLQLWQELNKRGLHLPVDRWTVSGLSNELLRCDRTAKCVGSKEERTQ